MLLNVVRCISMSCDALRSAGYLMLLELPLGSERLVADLALLWVVCVVDLEVQLQRAQLLEGLLTLRTREQPRTGWAL